MTERLFYTTRLNWRSLSMHYDQAAVYRQFADADMCRYFDEPPCTLAEAQAIITHYAVAPSDDRYCRFALIHRDTEAFVGTCGYHFLDRSLQSVEIGYDIWKEYWRQGYARELLPQLLDICFAVTDVNLVYAVIHPNNAASIGVVVSAGFVQIAPPPRIADTSCVVYGITRSERYSTTSVSGTAS